jgi:hypothetical protein
MAITRPEIKCLSHVLTDHRVTNESAAKVAKSARAIVPPRRTTGRAETVTITFHVSRMYV